MKCIHGRERICRECMKRYMEKELLEICEGCGKIIFIKDLGEVEKEKWNGKCSVCNIFHKERKDK